ncbi:hypothetical protein OM416_19580 [Paenibacillus sp. LS1]|uniref:hypothetical protein n=1 Tax=Paenibacillus sp. LS1 TaxID=2992120 RepID=UPI00222E9D55|nr:hypothetical protein [Paenibacillus sp. LS1]MCW3793797.1 hypothetical protein [Paenibacillus sp. LS1]
MKQINHITLNTGHIRRSSPDEIDKGMYFALKRIVNDSFGPDGTTVLDGYILKSSRIKEATIGTIYADDGIPIITTICTETDEPLLWEMMHDTATVPLDTERSKPAAGPYISDRLEVGAMEHLGAMVWSGDFSRCFGWICLSPSSIR